MSILNKKNSYRCEEYDYLLGNSCLEVKIIAEAEVTLTRQRLSKHLFSLQRMLTKAFPWQQKRTEELFDMVTSIPAAWQIKKAVHL
jgi:hypothetical protein